MLYKVTVKYRNILFSKGVKYHDSVDTAAGIVAALTAQSAKSKAASYYKAKSHLADDGSEERKVEIQSVEAIRVNAPQQVNLMVTFIIP